MTSESESGRSLAALVSVRIKLKLKRERDGLLHRCRSAEYAGGEPAGMSPERVYTRESTEEMSLPGAERNTPWNVAQPPWLHGCVRDSKDTVEVARC